jgi:hypothetical protein
MLREARTSTAHRGDCAADGGRRLRAPRWQSLPDRARCCQRLGGWFGIPISRYYEEVTYAHRSDGAWMQRLSAWLSHWFSKKLAGDIAYIVMPIEHLAINVDFSAKEYSIEPKSEMSCCLAPTLVRPSSPRSVSDCPFPGSVEYAGRFSKRAETVNGFPAIRFDQRPGGEQGFGPDEDTIWLAPSLGCQEVKRRSTSRNSYGIPFRGLTIDVDRFQFGEPDPALFLPPPGFRRVN